MSMSDKDINDFIKALTPSRDARPGTNVVMAEVVDVNGTLTDILVDGSFTPVPDVRKFSFTGTLSVGDTVWCLKSGPMYLILGELA